MEAEFKDFDGVYREFFPRLSLYLKRLVGQDAEDVTQEVFLKVSAALPGFRGESTLPTWIYRIATNTAMDHLRRARPVRTVLEINEIASGGQDSEDATEAGLEEGPALDTKLIRKEMNECISSIVDGLPENYRTVLVLSEMEGLQNAEIAQVLGISLDTVKIRLHRARARLRKELEANCNFYRDERNELACDRKVILL
ncbi:MAG: sigma-70 family RNA polymerase sigma factor [Nitrospiraceae bacterium]|nr:sigma-70 family RNA polymerase sigma factor [Nitrospiraceae bacterium]